MITHDPPDNMVDNDRVWWMEEWVQPLRNFGKLHPLNAKYLLEIFVAVYEFSFMCVLQVTLQNKDLVMIINK